MVYNICVIRRYRCNTHSLMHTCTHSTVSLSKLILSLSSVGFALQSWRKRRSALSESLHDIDVVSKYNLITTQQIVRGGL